MNSDEERSQALNDTDFATAVVKHAFAAKHGTTRTEDRVSDVLEHIQGDLISPLDRRVASLEQQVAELKATIAALRTAQTDFNRIAREVPWPVTCQPQAPE